MAKAAPVRGNQSSRREVLRIPGGGKDRNSVKTVRVSEVIASSASCTK